MSEVDDDYEVLGVEPIWRPVEDPAPGEGNDRGPRTSTPTRAGGSPPRPRVPPVQSSVKYSMVEGVDFEFLPGARNTGGIPHPDEPNHWTRAVWSRRRLRVFKYVDDGLTVEKANYENVLETVEDGQPVRSKHAVATQNAFRSVKAAAEAKGMRVNSSKTKLHVISDSISYRAAAFIHDAEGNALNTGKPPGRLKVLGFTFGDRPSVRPHVMTIRKKFRQRFWTLYNLKKNGFNEEELVKVYKTCIRPVADYLDIVYHSMLTDDLDEELDRLQNQALKIIFGTRSGDTRLGGRRLRELAGVTTLRERRVAHCDKFAAKCAESPRFGHWFPLRRGRRSARGSNLEKYQETFARCKRLRDSPLHFFRRRLNGNCLLYTSPSPRD